MSELATALVSTFRGRASHIAVGTERGFAPYPCPDSDKAQWLDERHLSGKQPLGFYLLTEQSTCGVSCVDFDNKPEDPDPLWMSKAQAVYDQLVGMNVVPLVEISQSGNAAHVWIVFSELVEAWIPREFWKALARKMGVEFKEIYPRQDTLGGKRMGNLVRYPLWNQSRFVDVENEWETIPPLQALRQVGRYTGSDLRLIAWQTGLGDIERKTPVVEGGGINGLSPRVQALIARPESLIGKRWANDTTGMKDTSSSAVAMSIAVELVRSYVPTPEIESALRVWCQKHSPTKGERDDWIRQTTYNAYKFLVERMEQKSVQMSTFESACLEYIKTLRTGGEHYISTGIGLLDASIDGISPGEMCIIAARPGHGKSAFCFQWLDYAAGHGVPGLIISEEMTATSIGKRRLLSVSGLPAEQWSQETADDLERDVREYHRNRAPVYIVENCNSIARVDEIIDQYCRLYGVGIVAVDYLQLLTARKDVRYDDVTEISRRLKQAASRNNCAMLALSQLNRDIEKRGKYEPKSSDLRESGQIEQDADMIMFLVWMHSVDPSKPAYDYQIWVTKRRNGPIRQRRVDTTFNPERQIIGGTQMQVPKWEGVDYER